jgi:3-carboxy-cis,cis-muconate cycloisomerase
VTFDAVFVPDALLDAVSERAWLRGMLAFERALAAAEAEIGVIPADAAAAIAAACDVDRVHWPELVAGARAAGNPAEPLVRAVRGLAGEAASYVHWGATSQDTVDTAAMLVARDARDLVLAELDGAAAACAALAQAHRSTPIAGRTLLQQAVPTTFGAKAAGWLVSLVEAGRGLRRVELAVQLGGAAGTLAALGDRGLDVRRLLAADLGLVEPALPWHTNRVRVAELGSTLAVAAGAAGKIGLDVALLSQTEVAEVREPAGSGGSSTLPHKRNPVGSAVALACARRANACASVLTAALVHEHERALGAWQSEWSSLSDALALAGGAAAATRRTLEGLEVDPARMRANMTELLGAEHASFLLAERVGKAEAHERVGEASRSESFRDGLAAAGLSAEEVDRALDPAAYLGSAEALVDRALDLYEGGGR